MNNNPPIMPRLNDIRPDRRDFIKSLLAVAAISVADVQKIIANPLTDVSPVLQATKGMTIHDIIVGFWGWPGDLAWRVSFFRQSAVGKNESMPVLVVPMNQRATFRWVCRDGDEIVLSRGRWVCRDGDEIVLSRGQKLVPTFECYSPEGNSFQPPKYPAEPIVSTFGRDLANGKMIINQSFYA